MICPGNISQLLIPALLLMQAPGASAPAPAPASTAAATAEDKQEMEEVLVRGTHMYELRAAIVEAEDRFFDLYNDLNKVDDFRISCTMIQLTGTKLNQRYCRTRLDDRAQSDEARSFLEAVQEGAAQARGMDAASVIMAHEQEYRRNFAQLLVDNPELLEKAKEVEAAMTRYEQERVKRARGRLISWK